MSALPHGTICWPTRASPAVLEDRHVGLAHAGAQRRRLDRGVHGVEAHAHRRGADLAEAGLGLEPIPTPTLAGSVRSGAARSAAEGTRPRALPADRDRPRSPWAPAAGLERLAGSEPAASLERAAGLEPAAEPRRRAPRVTRGGASRRRAMQRRGALSVPPGDDATRARGSVART